MVRILALVKACGVQWSRQEQERRLFPLCVHVQAVLMERHGRNYTTCEVGLVPDEYVDEVKEIIGGELSTHRERD